MSKNKKRFPDSVPVVCVYVFLTLAVLFIWSRSLKSIPESQGESLRVLEFLRPFLELFVGSGNVTDHLVRKLAHFAEFFILGCGLAVLPVLRRRVSAHSAANCLFAGASVAVVDEAIQLFTARGSLLSDVLLDIFGATCGVLLVTGIYSMAKRYSRVGRKKRKPAEKS